MSNSSKDLDHLIELMAKLPGLGPRSARRAVLHMVKKRALLMTPLAGTADTCDICQNPKRENGEICVVEEVSDLWAMERSHMFKGRYHVLGGTLSALDAIGPDELRIPGQTTAHYIADQLGDVRISTLAQGVPIGGELDYLDDGTITAALRARKTL